MSGKSKRKKDSSRLKRSQGLQVQPPTSGLKQFVQYLQAVPKRVGPILTGLSLVGGLFAYSVLWPSLSLTNIQANHQSVFSTKFLLTNDGWFSIYNVKISCIFTVTEYKPNYDGPKLVSNTTFSSLNHVNTLKSSERLSDSCEFSMLENMPKINGTSGLSLTPKEILTYATGAHLAMSVTFKPFFQWPINIQFPFKMDMDRGLVDWIPEPLEHYESAMEAHAHPK